MPVEQTLTLLAQERPGINIKLPVLGNVVGIVKQRGNGRAAPRVAGQDDIAADVPGHTVDMKLLRKRLHRRSFPPRNRGMAMNGFLRSRAGFVDLSCAPQGRCPELHRCTRLRAA